MIISRGQVILLSVLAVCLLVVTAVVWHDVNAGQSNNDQLAFQQYIGGVGLGSVTAPAWNFSDYDPRLQDHPEDDLYPIPGGNSYTPDRLGMVTRFAVTQSMK